LDEKKISGFEGISMGVLGLFIFIWDWLLFNVIEDIGFSALFIIVLAVGVYVLKSKGTVELDMTSKYASSY